MASETTHIRVYKTDKIRLWNLINAEQRKLADVINHLLDKEENK